MSTLSIPRCLLESANAADGAGYVPEAVTVLSPRLVPPHLAAPAPDPVPRVAVRWAVPPCADGDGATAGVLHGGGAS